MTVTVSMQRGPAASEVLAGLNATSVTRQLVALAVTGGLHPHAGEMRRGLYPVYLSYPSRDGLFGALHVSARNGNVVRANLTHGNSGTEARYERVADVRRALRDWIRGACHDFRGTGNGWVTLTQAEGIDALCRRLGRACPELSGTTFEQAGDLIVSLRAEIHENGASR